MAVGGTAVLTMHPFLSGRPSRVVALERLVERVRTETDATLVSLGQMVELHEELSTVGWRERPGTRGA